METKFRLYRWEDSLARINATLGQSSGFLEVDSLPTRDQLTFENGFYANASALFIDIRGSSELPALYKRPVLAKIYRAFISECVAVMNGNARAHEVNIVGDCVWGVFDTPNKPDIDSVFGTAATLNSLVKMLNCRLSKHGYSTGIRVGIGAAWGRALVIKAGYKGSGINDIVYMGDVVNRASKCAGHGGVGIRPVLVIDETFAHNLNAENQSLLQPEFGQNWRTGDIVRTDMEEWRKANC